MTDTRDTNAETHEQVFELLPWFVNGTLTETDHAVVQAHIKVCLLCRRELDAQRNLREMFKDSETIPLRPHHGLSTLMEKIDAQSKPAPFMERIRPLSMRLPIAAATVGIALGVVLAIALSGKDERQEPLFRTLSENAVIVEDDAPLLQVIFRDSVAQTEVQSIVSGMGGRVIAGPSGTAAYTIEVNPSDMDRSLKQFRSDARVRFAEHARVLSARE